MHEWVWIATGALSLGALVQEARIYKMRRNWRNQEEIFQVVTENAADMIALVDVKGHRLYNSPSYKRILGYSPAELSETSSFEQIHPDDRMRVLEAARDARESGVGKRLEYRIKHKDGSWRVLESVASTIRDGKGEVAKLVIVNRDITQRKRAEAQLEYNLFHDPLTGLPNRRMFLDRLQTAFTRARREAGGCYALLLVNIDHFKVFNDTMGTQSGDQVLIDIARRIGGTLRQELSVVQLEAPTGSGDVLLFRLGGDEFAILLDSVADPSDAMRTATSLLIAVAEPLHVDAREVRASISIGIALNTHVHTRPEDALKDADVAMRRAKALGGSRCEVFDEAMHTRAVGRLRLEADLRTAFTERQFRIHYQPVVHLETRRVVSFEALLRWEHPTQGLISPYRFIETAEDTGILVSIGHWLIVQACMQLREWEMSARGGEPMNLTVNLSARQLADARLANDIQGALQQTGIDPARLQLEMTEGVAAADSKLTVTVLSHLKHLGIKTILDNFGTGSMSLLELARFPVDALKIDRSLVREMQSDKSATDIVELIITLAHKMQFQAIAEGIESARQLQRLQELGCEYGQGYYFSQPMDASAALRFMQQQVVAAQATRAGK
ncbi:MAG TPA: EAL domain-containing protein [Candidatus Eisenbacteria bacterium]|nr:EAL domain-containing protein [Candidatus Eisenbacteria bacterium]